ncbi:RNA polymerase subunit sigma-70 [Xylophilus sp. Kf1]|nr:RNA polymerase subunit sigma-70 [Xylophilus sp. Kf1]
MSDSDRSDDGAAGGVQALAGEYVLGTLSGAGRRAVEARLAAGEPDLRNAVAGWEARLLPLTGLVQPVEPTDSLWERITHSVAALERRAVPVATGAGAALPHGPAGRSRSAPGGWWNNLALWRGLSAAGCAAAVVMASVLVLREPAGQPPKYLVVLVGPQDKAPGWVVQASARGGSVDLIPLVDSAVPAEKSLQFWTKADGWKGPVSLGLVRPGQTIQVPLASLPPLQANQLFELTLEPAAGSPIDRPTGPVQFIGRAVKVL